MLILSCSEILLKRKRERLFINYRQFLRCAFALTQDPLTGELAASKHIQADIHIRQGVQGVYTGGVLHRVLQALVIDFLHIGNERFQTVCMEKEVGQVCLSLLKERCNTFQRIMPLSSAPVHF